MDREQTVWRLFFRVLLSIYITLLIRSGRLYGRMSICPVALYAPRHGRLSPQPIAISAHNTIQIMRYMRTRFEMKAIPYRTQRVQSALAYQRRRRQSNLRAGTGRQMPENSPETPPLFKARWRVQFEHWLVSILIAPLKLTCDLAAY